MQKLKHPITRAEYLRNTDGTVCVSSAARGSGVFDRKGRWLSGPLRIADPLMCMFVSDGYRATVGSSLMDAAINTKDSDA